MSEFSKKYYFVLAVIFLVVGGMYFYRNSQKININTDLYNDAVSSINIADLYLSGSLDAKEAKERVKKLNYERHYNEDIIEEWDVKFDIGQLELSFGLGSDSSIREARNNLAKEIGYK